MLWPTMNKSPSRHKTFELVQHDDCWEVLHPVPASAATRADDNALVLLGNFYGIKILLLSDLSREGQSLLLSRTNDLHAGYGSWGWIAVKR